MRYWSYSVAIGLPSRSVMVVTNGGGSSASSADNDSTVSLAWFDDHARDRGDREQRSRDEYPGEQAETEYLEQTPPLAHAAQVTHSPVRNRVYHLPFRNREVQHT